MLKVHAYTTVHDSPQGEIWKGMKKWKGGHPRHKLVKLQYSVKSLVLGILPWNRANPDSPRRNGHSDRRRSYIHSHDKIHVQYAQCSAEG